MGKGCITATKYFLFLFNLIFFICGVLIMSFGLWVLLDNQSFIAVLQESSTTLKVASYILITVGSLSMVMGFLGCIGAIYEIRCLLGLLQQEMSTIVKGMLVNYTGQNRTTEHSWDYVQRTMKCCGWVSPGNWLENVWIKNSSVSLYPCSCRNETLPGTDMNETGLCEHLSADRPVYQTGCMHSVEAWLLENCGVILGICVGVAVLELLGMILSMCLCKSVVQEDYTKVPKY
uniref:Tetraspanin n=1 Tax=Oncorhynchus tshawytscha TaxID=74940 RepID=A0AAZ3Q6M5_ONCTS